MFRGEAGFLIINNWDFMGFHGICWDKNGDLDLAISDWISWGYNSGYSETRPGKLTVCELEHGPVETVDLPSYKMVDLSIVMLVITTQL